MNSNEFSSLTRKVLKVYNVIWLEGPNLAPEYSCETFSGSSPSETGHVRVFEIALRTTPKMPRFIARWDEKADALDIDLMDVSKDVIRCFKGQKSGYSGHHCRRVSHEPRAFEIRVILPGTIVCCGVLSLNLLRGMSVGGDLAPSGDLSQIKHTAV